MLLLLPLLTVLVVSSPFCLADFITPPAASTQTNVDANPEYKEWDTIQINLSTSFSSFSISLFQAGNNTSGVLILSNKTLQDLPSSWIIDVSHFDTSSRGSIPGNVFYLRADEYKGSGSIRTHGFNVSQQSQDSSQTASTTSPAAAAVSSGAMAPATSTASSSSSTSDESSASGLSAAAKVGIGFGVAMGALALVGCAAFWWRRRAHQAQSQHNDAPAKGVLNEAATGKRSPDVERSMSLGSASPGPWSADSIVGNRQGPVAELDDSCFHELDANPRTPREPSM